MCGIVGVAGDLQVVHENIFKELLIVDGLRGDHSTGVLQVQKKHNTWKVIKKAENPYTFSEDKDYNAIFRFQNRVLLGHNRYATKGAINDENAHPFKHGTIIGVHNGTIGNPYSLKKGHEFKVDSDALYYEIFKEGIEDVYKKVYGPMALVWWNDFDSSLNFVRNKERPLHYYISPDNKFIIWASEMEMLWMCMSRSSLEFKNKHIKQFDINKHYKINLPIDFKEIKMTHNVLVPHEKPKITLFKGNSEYFYGDKEDRWLKFKLDKIVRNNNADVYHGKTDFGDEVRLVYYQGSEPKLNIWYEGLVSYTYFVGTKEVFYIQNNSKKIISNEDKEEEREESSYDEFCNRYITCVYCGDPVFYGERNLEVTEKDILCPNCRTGFENLYGDNITMEIIINAAYEEVGGIK